MIGDSLKDKKLLVRQLIPFGFQKEGATYRFSQPIVDGQFRVEIANFKIVPENLSEMLKKDGYFPAYHMNKKTWMTVLLDGTVPFSEIQRLLDASYELA